MTIVVLLILAGITLTYVLGDNSVFKKATEAKLQTQIAQAREKLEIVLSGAKIEKHTNAQYNENEFLDEYIISQIEQVEIIGDIAVVDGYAFELDRSVPCIGEYVGKKEDLIFPVVTVAEVIKANPTDSYRTATISITVTIDEKATNGISRIEIWQNATKLSTIPCNNEKTVTKEYIANKNGIYTIKAYADISGSAKTRVEGIVPTVEFTPNGSIEWKKKHTTTVKVNETAEKVTGMKYLWRKSDESQPQVENFTENCINNSTITGQGESMTGKYYLWVLVTVGTGSNTRTYICGSEEFYFDNEGPNITSFMTTKDSLTSIMLNATIQDKQSGITKIEFYVDNILKDTETYKEAIENVNKSKAINDLTTGTHKCRIVVYDKQNNFSEKIVDKASTMLYTWVMYNVNVTHHYKLNFVYDSSVTWRLA